MRTEADSLDVGAIEHDMLRQLDRTRSGMSSVMRLTATAATKRANLSPPSSR